LDYAAELLVRALLLGCAAMVVAYLSDEAGILHVASAGLIGVGAYGSAVLVSEQHMPVPVAIVIMIPIGALCGLLLHAFTRRLTASYLAMALLSVTVVLHGLMSNWISVTGGPMGLADIPPLPLSLGEQPAVLAGAAVGLGFGLTHLRATVFGARVRAVRDDEVLSRDLRLQPDSVRLILLVGSSSVFALIGGVYAHHLRYLDPSSFDLRESIAILAMAFLAPTRNVMRGLVGALVFVMMPEGLRFVGLPAAVAAQLRQVLFGVLLLVVVSTGKKTAAGGAAGGVA
jgi:branched-chain amino acid transport system permease protein